MTDPGRYRLLIIEDDPEIQHILSVIVRGHDREIVAAETAEQARALLQEGDIVRVVLDRQGRVA